MEQPRPTEPAPADRGKVEAKAKTTCTRIQNYMLDELGEAAAILFNAAGKLLGKRGCTCSHKPGCDC